MSFNVSALDTFRNANLGGSIRPIDVPVKTGEFVDDDGNKVPTYKFEPLLDNEGRP